jgi:hypothetical protein
LEFDRGFDNDRDKMNMLGTDKFGEKWVKRTMSSKDQESTCSKDRFILSVLAEMGVIDFQHHITPLIKVIVS